MNQLSKNSTNAELQGYFGESLKSGKARIFAIEESKNPLYKTIYICQVAKKPNAATSTAQSFFLGWDDTRILRTIHNASADVVAAKGLKAGQEVPFDILSEEKIFPAYEGQEPKVNPKTAEVIMFQGNRVYEHTQLVAVGEGRIVQLANQQAAVIVTATEVFEKAKAGVEAAAGEERGF
jgi:hypothetical protein